jgi:aldehyde:ferredoxin oxidoreductase
MIYNGWTKRALWINLSNKTSWVDPISDKICKDYLGGRGFAIKTLFDNVGPNVKAFDPDNLLIFAVGPTAGTPFPGRMSFMTKSPQTGRFTDGNGGGYFSAKMHYAGYDMLIISGESPKPVVLVIDDDRVTFEDASNLWGKTTYETEKDLAYRLGSSYQFKYIGPAGENLVNISIIMGNRYSAIGRTGGAVMGKKKLKAIAIRGSNEFQPVDKEAFKKHIYSIWDELNPETCKDPFIKPWNLQGSTIIGRMVNTWGCASTENGQKGVYDNITSFSGDRLFRDGFMKAARSCFGCNMQACRHAYEIQDGKWKGTRAESVQAGTLVGMGCNTRMTSPEAIIKAHSLCNELGLCLLSVGCVIGWAMEAWQKEIINSNHTNGLKLEFGDEDVVMELIQRIAHRENIGDILANGVKQASEHLGGEEFALHIKGLEYTDIEPRAYYQMGLSYAVNDMGGDHTRVYPPYPPPFPALTKEELASLPFDAVKAAKRNEIENKGYFVKWLYDSRAALNCFEGCAFLSRGRLFSEYGLFADLLTALTGEQYTASDLLKIGERVVNLERLYIIREGFDCNKDDTLPKRFLEQGFPKGGSAGMVVPIEPMVKEYYEARGWDRFGRLTEKKIRELGLESEASDTYSCI